MSLYDHSQLVIRAISSGVRYEACRAAGSSSSSRVVPPAIASRAKLPLGCAAAASTGGIGVLVITIVKTNVKITKTNSENPVGKRGSGVQLPSDNSQRMHIGGEPLTSLLPYLK